MLEAFPGSSGIFTGLLTPTRRQARGFPKFLGITKIRVLVFLIYHNINNISVSIAIGKLLLLSFILNVVGFREVILR